MALIALLMSGPLLLAWMVLGHITFVPCAPTVLFVSAPLALPEHEDGKVCWCCCGHRCAWVLWALSASVSPSKAAWQMWGGSQ